VNDDITGAPAGPAPVEPGSAPEGPLVPPGWIPAVTQPAKGRPANPLTLAVVIVAGFLLSCGAWVVVRGAYVDSMLETARYGVEAAVSDDVRALEPLLPAGTAASPAFRAALAKARPRANYTFTDHVYSSGLSANLSDPGGVWGSYWLRTDRWGFGELSVEWAGPPFGSARGTVLLELEDDGWRVWSITVGGRTISFAPEDAATTFSRPGG
jgi:hypothetical protein